MTPPTHPTRTCSGPASGLGRGFTLIETIAAILLLAIAIPPMLWAMRDAHIQRVNPTMVITAQWLAAEKLEDIIADRHAPDLGYASLEPANYPDEPSINGFLGFERSVAFNETGPDLESEGDGYMTVTVYVRWIDATGTERDLTISTVLTEYES